MATFAKPENALKRAEELINVGQQQAALQALHDLITSKRYRAWQKPLERIMFKYVELCVELRRGRFAKDGLIQYRIICQQVNVSSLEEVIKHFLHLSTEKAEQARSQAQALEEALDVDDLEADNRPEDLMLSYVSGEKERREALYAMTAHRAFQFCKQYKRTTEFRRLCEIIRNHLSNLNKYRDQRDRPDLSVPESLQLYLDTRFEQLKIATELELWQEAFRSVEDIHGLMCLVKKSPKPSLMVVYYAKLTEIFWISESHLYHAYSWFRLFTLQKSYNKNLTQKDLQLIASSVVLAALAVTPYDHMHGASHMELEKEKERNLRMASLMGFSLDPKRESREEVSKGVMTCVSQDVKDLFNLLEHEFLPLDLASRVQPLLTKIAKLGGKVASASSLPEVQLSQYVPAMEKLACLRVLQQVSQVYQTMKIDVLSKMIPFFPFSVVEKLSVDAIKYNFVCMKVDHLKGVVLFGNLPYRVFTTIWALSLLPFSIEGIKKVEDVLLSKDQCDEGGFSKLCDLHVAVASGEWVECERAIAFSLDNLYFVSFFQDLESDRVRDHLTVLAECLNKARSLIYPPAKKASKLSDILPVLAETVDKEHKRLLARKSIIERRKEERERQMLEMEESKRLKLQKITEEAEQKRLAFESSRREEQRIRREIEERELEEAQALLMQAERKNKKKGKKPIIEGEVTKQAILDLALSEQVRERQEMEKKLQKSAKTMDYLERAKREEQAPLIEAAYQTHLIEEKILHEHEQQLEIELSKQRYAGDLQEKNRLVRMLANKVELQKSIESRRDAELNQQMKERQDQVSQIKSAREQERARKRKMIFYLNVEEERQKKLQEEEDARKREEAERKKKEEAEHRAKMDEIAEKQRQREREIEERARKEREAQLGRLTEPLPRPSADLPPGGRAVEPVAAAAAAVTAAASGLGSAPTTGKYVPRHMRDKNKAPGTTPPEPDRWGSRHDDHPPPPSSDRSDRWRDDRSSSRSSFGSSGGLKSTWTSSRVPTAR
ncbi:hypothetical protein Sjap_020060 [Stephania japonica]|uniref:Eukaryotic translation initiation factor 3 subunit A n=1 Tax=Stephania japonica TaxID=461633 RepID=A0AAP0F1E2_9MAGN